MWRLNRDRSLLVIAAVITASLALWLSWGSLRPATDANLRAAGENATVDRDKPLRKDKREVSDQERADLLARAQVWRQPRVPISRASFKGATLDEVTCRFKVTDLGGTTPKFDCELEDGEEIRIKYGNGPEVPTEAAATRLLSALGFGADHVVLVSKLRCYGCPEEPFSTMRAVEITRGKALYEQMVDFDSYEDFEWVALERKLDARPVETDLIEGWSFFELDRVDPARGGAPRAHVDALRLIAILLAHWDNKSENQRLVCLTREWPDDEPCAEPFLLLQDVGATFGPSKFDLAAWKQVPMWEDRSTCTVSMHSLPFKGATFGQARISEGGRLFAAKLLSALSRAQLMELFSYARFAEPRGVMTAVSSVSEWADAFEEKVRAVSDGAPCPAL